MKNNKSYEIYFHLEMSDCVNFDLSPFFEQEYFNINYEPIDTIGKYNKIPKDESLLIISSKTQGKEFLSFLFDFILNLDNIGGFILKYNNAQKVLHISQNYWYQCNLEIDINLLAILVKYNISLAISSIYCRDE
jgi:hypothetical protein